MKLSQLVLLSSSAEAAWRDKWVNKKLMFAARSSGDMQNCLDTAKNITLKHPIDMGKWSCSDASSGTVSCKGSCLEEGKRGQWKKMEFRVYCKPTRPQPVRKKIKGPASCKKQQSCFESVQSKPTHALKSALNNQNIIHGYWGECRGSPSKETCRALCIEGYEPKWRSKAPVSLTLDCKKDRKKLTPKNSAIHGELACKPSREQLCKQPEIETPQGSLSFAGRGGDHDERHVYDLVCDDGSVVGQGECENGFWGSELGDWPNSCARFDCSQDDVNELYPLFNGQWKCTDDDGNKNCAADCNNPNSRVRWLVTCSAYGDKVGWHISSGQAFVSVDECLADGEEAPVSEFKQTTKKLPPGLETCSQSVNFPASVDGARLLGGDRIVGGVTADAHSMPWMALLGVKTTSGWVGQCAGSIIADRWVVTAAHCCRGIVSITAKFGEHDRWGSSADEFALTTTRMFVHPKYYDASDDGTKMNFDICLLRFDDNILDKAPNKEVVKTACLPTEDVEHGDACWVGGWGATRYGSGAARVLQSVGVNIMDHAYCENFSNSIIPRPGKKFQGMFTDVLIKTTSAQPRPTKTATDLRTLVWTHAKATREERLYARETVSPLLSESSRVETAAPGRASPACTLPLS